MKLPRKPGCSILIPEAQLSLVGICRLPEKAGFYHSEVRVQPALLWLLGSWLQVPKSTEVNVTGAIGYGMFIYFIGPISSALTRLASQMPYQSYNAPDQKGPMHAAILSYHCLGMHNCSLHKVLCIFPFVNNIFGSTHYSILCQLRPVAS